MQALSLAAAPTFAIMALLTGIHGGSMPDMLCSAAGNGLPLSGMFYVFDTETGQQRGLKPHRAIAGQINRLTRLLDQS